MTTAGAEVTPAAPLDLAVARLRSAIADNPIVSIHAARAPRCPCVECAAVPLLAALDADKRLEEAEAALKAIADNVCDCDSTTDGHSNECPRRASVKTRIARRYFARREEKEVNRG